MVPAFAKRRGLWLPRRSLDIPQNLLHAPTASEWTGLWRPMLPQRVLSLVTYDLSCLPCCTADCRECDPALNDAGYPITIDDLNIAISGAITTTDTLVRSTCGGAGKAWDYGNPSIAPSGTCGGEFVSIAACVYCASATGIPHLALTGGGGGCTFLEADVAADSFSCNPFSATFTFHTDDIFLGGCPCGDNAVITAIVTE